MADPLWHTKPILQEYSDTHLSAWADDIRARTWDAVKNDPLSINRQEDWYNMMSYIDLE